MSRASAAAVSLVTVCCLLCAAASAAAREYPQPKWRNSRSVGLPWNGRLVDGVELPARGRTYFTWDPVLRRSPDRPWRRWGNDQLVRILLSVLSAYRAAHPHAARVGVGDLSRPRGGNFGRRYGGLGHVSHQNGLDVDVYYPRKDRREAAPTSPGQVDQRLAQDLVNRFVAAGAVHVFVGPHLDLRGPRRIVEPLPYHDNHMHVRIANPVRPRALLLGRSVEGRPIRAFRVGDPASAHTLLVVGCIHGDECAGTAVTKRLVRRRIRRPLDADLWVIPCLNPDGRAHGTRQNAHGVDLNRNFPSEWRASRPEDPEYSGPRPLSEPETRIAVALVRRIHPDVTIWFHQPQNLVRAWGRSVRPARRFAHLVGLPFRAIRWPLGTAPNWQNRKVRRGASFVVELPPGPLTAAAASREMRAVLALARQ